MDEIETHKIYYNSISKSYKELHWMEQEKKINEIIDYLNFEDKRILDLGSGDGVLNGYIFGNEIFSCDISKNLLFLNSNRKENKFCIDIDRKELPFKNNFFDVIISISVFQNLKNFDFVISEIKRVCKKDNLIIISFIKQTNKKEEIEKALIDNFDVKKIIEEEIDLIFILKNVEIEEIKK